MRKPVRRRSVPKTHLVSRTPISLAILSLFGSVQVAIAQDAPPAEEVAATPEATRLDDIVVTATRRDKGLQDIPFNISAVRGEDIDRQNLTDMESLARVIPGVFLLNQGARAASLVVIRGLNTSSIAASEGNGNANGGVMATYIGDVPLYVDLKLLDLDRVEVLLGPQGTLYGAGTLGGALRYIPNRPDFEKSTFELDTSGSVRAHSDNLGRSLTLVANQPVSETMAIRASAGYFYDPGFIDYNHLVREAGVSDPEPVLTDPADVAANLRRKKDADDEDTTTARVALGVQLTPALRGDLTYHYQMQDAGGRTVNHVGSYDTGPYESAHRFVEPNERENQLASLELNADLGFATLTSATGYSRYDEVGQRDQTDLLLNFEYGYEDFPSFAAFTRETSDEKSINQELRLVSPDEGPLNWIAGVFYNRFDLDATSSEFVPGFPASSRPDDLEYYQASYQTFTEKALFGELGYQFTGQWQGNVGLRWFDFEDDQKVGFDLPLISGTPPDQINPVFDENDVSDDDVIFKVNTSYKFGEDLLGYATISEGYRSGGVNAVPPCPDPLPGGPNVCALPNEQLIKPDKTLNHEIGVRSAWLDNRLVLNAALFYIDWSDVQVAGVTVNGAIPITVNGAEARSQGLELTAKARLLDQFKVTTNYSYTDAELTKDSPGIVEGQDAFKGDRLPASPKHQVNVSFMYDELLPNGWNLTADYGIFAISNVYSRLGLRAGGEQLGGFAVHSASVGVGTGPWKVRLFANNLFDRYAETGMRAGLNDIRDIPTDDPAPDDIFRLRRYYKDVLEPLTIGVRFSYDFLM